MNQPITDQPSSATLSGNERDILLTLFDLGRKVASVIDLDELLPRIPELIGRLIPFDAFAVYLVSEKRQVFKLGYAVGYPDESRGFEMNLSEGILGRVVATQQPLVIGDVTDDAQYVSIVPDMRSTLAVPLIHKSKAIGVLNVLSRARDRYSERDVAILRQFAAHVATALVNARLFAQERHDAEAFEALAEIGREMAGVLDLDRLLSRTAQLLRRLVDYRTFGILLLNDASGELEIKMAVQYGETVELPTVPVGDGLVGYAALHREAVYAPDVSKDPRYIRVLDDVRSELVVPMLVKDRCVGVFDLESPELDAFSKRDVEILTLLASQAAVAVENARLYAQLSANEARIERELRFAQRVQTALLPSQLPKKVRGVDVAVSFAPARELGGDFHDFLVPESNTLIIAVGDESGKGVPAALYSVFAGELVRGRTFRRRYVPDQSSPAKVLTSINTILHERQLEEYFCALCYSLFDLKRRTVTLANSGVPYPIYATGDSISQIEVPGVPLGSFFGMSYDEVTLPLMPGDVFVFCSDGVHEAMNILGEEFSADGVIRVLAGARHLPSKDIVARISQAVEEHRAGFPPNDDTTIVVLRITEQVKGPGPA
jgi:sigma-B regulation protein RsbU (phosphoserine phosphatase)